MNDADDAGLDEELISAFDDAVNDYYFSDFKGAAKKNYQKTKAALLERLSTQRREIEELRRERERWKARDSGGYAPDGKTWKEAMYNEAAKRGQADGALQQISLLLGGTDEWTDQPTMIAYVLDRAKSAEAALAEAVKFVKFVSSHANYIGGGRYEVRFTDKWHESASTWAQKNGAWDA